MCVHYKPTAHNTDSLLCNCEIFCTMEKKLYTYIIYIYI